MSLANVTKLSWLFGFPVPGDEGSGDDDDTDEELRFKTEDLQFQMAVSDMDAGHLRRAVGCGGEWGGVGYVRACARVCLCVCVCVVLRGNAVTRRSISCFPV